MSSPDLALPISTEQFMVEADASDGQVGCVLLQQQKAKHPKPIDYWTRSQDSAEHNYDRTRKQCLAILCQS